MPRPKRNVLATAVATSTPPDSLSESQSIARVVKAMGNNIFNVEQADGKELLVELPAQFRSTFWIKRGGYVVVDSQALAERENKLHGEIVNVVREERMWRKMEYWYVVGIGGRRRGFSDIDRPSTFSKKVPAVSSDEEDNSRVGKMPPSDSEQD